MDKLPVIFLFMIAYLYFIGWTYLFTFFDRLSISASSIGINWQELIIYSYSVIDFYISRIAGEDFYSFSILFILLSIILIYFNELLFCHMKLFFSKNNRHSYIYLILVFFIVAGLYAAQIAAIENSKLLRVNGERVQLTFVDPDGLPKRLVRLNDGKKLYYITSSKDWIFVHSQKYRKNSDRLEPAWIFKIPWNQLTAARLELKGVLLEPQ